VARFAEGGGPVIHIQVQHIGTDDLTIADLTPFLSGREIARGGAIVGHSLSVEGNPCSELLIETETGTLRASGHINYDYSAPLFGPTGDVRFAPLQSQFAFFGAGPPHYWLLPLYNFISERWESTTALDEHPLRLQPSRISRPGTMYRSGLIGFTYNGRPGFTQALRDYASRVERLTSGREQSVVTALMVGEVAGEAADFAELQKWFPVEVLSFLGLATGVEIGAPWLEICDQSGSVARRFHVSFGQPKFSTARATIRQGLHTGIGYLLSQSLASIDRHSSALRSAVDNVIRSGLLDSGTVEEKLVYLFRALDGLCNEFNLSKGANPSTALSSERAAALRTALAAARAVVTKLAVDAKELDQNDQVEFLYRVAEQIQKSGIVGPGFAGALLRLLEKFGLHDAEVMRAHYGNDTGWMKVLRRYRGIAVHRNYFDFFAGDDDIREVARVIFHLHDILVRIVLKRLNYDGTYQPTVVKWLVDAELDWVRPDTPASMLGYPDVGHQPPGAQGPDEEQMTGLEEA